MRSPLLSVGRLLTRTYETGAVPVSDRSSYDRYLDNLGDVAVRLQKEAAEGNNSRARPLTVAFFDLSGSAEAKMSYGNTAAIADSLSFTSLADNISTAFDGQVVKTMGDGAMAVFHDSVQALRAALALRWATGEYLNLPMRAGLTLGTPRKLDLGGGRVDYLGDVVDRAARVQGLAARNQVVVDRALFDDVRAELATHPEWVVDEEPRVAFARGIGNVELFEFAIRGKWALKKQVATPFVIMPAGRPSLSEKLALIRHAKKEIVEIGIGLTSFSAYFTGQQPQEFRDPIRSLVRGGVDLRCYCMNLSFQSGLSWLGEQGNDTYVTEAEIARRRIATEARYQRENNFVGSTSLFEFELIPEFWCLGVDVDDPVDGRMFYASYMLGIARSATPVTQVSVGSNPELYAKFLETIREIRSVSTVVPRV